VTVFRRFPSRTIDSKLTCFLSLPTRTMRPEFRHTSHNCWIRVSAWLQSI